MIGIISCQIGNIGSLMNAFTFIGAQAEVVEDPCLLGGYSGIVLPGVGAFDAAMASVTASGFGAAIRDYANGGRPVLGICVGLQILCEGSEEGTQSGLGLIEGTVRHLRSLGGNGKVPHVGFNSVSQVTGRSAFLQTCLDRDFYFVHSYALDKVSDGIDVAYTEYEGARFIAALNDQNLFATQFHPEKSGEAGLALLQQFLSCSKNV